MKNLINKKVVQIIIFIGLISSQSFGQMISVDFLGDSYFSSFKSLDSSLQTKSKEILKEKDEKIFDHFFSINLGVWTPFYFTKEVKPTSTYFPLNLQFDYSLEFKSKYTLTLGYNRLNPTFNYFDESYEILNSSIGMWNYNFVPSFSSKTMYLFLLNLGFNKQIGLINLKPSIGLTYLKVDWLNYWYSGELSENYIFPDPLLPNFSLKSIIEIYKGLNFNLCYFTSFTPIDGPKDFKFWINSLSGGLSYKI